MLMIYLSMLDDEREQQQLTMYYNEYSKYCIHLATLVLGNESWAEDAVHEAFLSIMYHKEKYFALDSRDFRKKLVIIVKNKCIDILRKNKRISAEPFEDFEYSISSDEPPVDIQVINKEEFQRMADYLSQIDEVSRLVLILKYTEGLSYKEIGEELGMTPKHVDTRIYRAKEKLRKLIGKEGGKGE
jgi:RNA polymerase sigma factor, sigma-70 family